MKVCARRGRVGDMCARRGTYRDVYVGGVPVRLQWYVCAWRGVEVNVCARRGMKGAWCAGSWT